MKRSRNYSPSPERRRQDSVRAIRTYRASKSPPMAERKAFDPAFLRNVNVTHAYEPNGDALIMFGSDQTVFQVSVAKLCHHSTYFEQLRRRDRARACCFFLGYEFILESEQPGDVKCFLDAVYEEGYVLRSYTLSAVCLTRCLDACNRSARQVPVPKDVLATRIRLGIKYSAQQVLRRCLSDLVDWREDILRRGADPCARERPGEGRKLDRQSPDGSTDDEDPNRSRSYDSLTDSDASQSTSDPLVRLIWTRFNALALASLHSTDKKASSYVLYVCVQLGVIAGHGSVLWFPDSDIRTLDDKIMAGELRLSSAFWERRTREYINSACWKDFPSPPAGESGDPIGRLTTWKAACLAQNLCTGCAEWVEGVYADQMNHWLEVGIPEAFDLL